MTDHPLLSDFVAHLRAALPDNDRIQALLTGLTDTVYADLASHLSKTLGGLDVVLALPDGTALAQALAGVLGLPLVPVTGRSGAWSMAPQALLQRPRGLLVSRELDGGVPELEVAVLAQGLGCEVRALACVLERSTAQGRYRLLQLGVQTHAAVRVAETPAGWIIERRQLDGQGQRPH